MNKLLIASMPLLTLLIMLKHTEDHGDVDKLNQQTSREITHFQQRLSDIQYPDETIMAARYILCAAIDEAVLRHSWGLQSYWCQYTLLQQYHRETNGGERFYQLIELMSQEPRRHSDFLELSFVLLCLGFEGKLYASQDSVREEIRNRLFYLLRINLPKVDNRLSLTPTSINQLSHHHKKRPYLRRKSKVLIAIVMTVAFYCNLALYQRSDTYLKQLNSLARTPALTRFSTLLRRPMLRRQGAI